MNRTPLLTARQKGVVLGDEMPIYGVAESPRFCQFQSHTLYSFRDMIALLACDLRRVWDNLDYYRREYMDAASRLGASSELNEGDKEALLKQLEALHRLCEKLELPASHDRERSLHRRLIGFVDLEGCQHNVIAASLEDLLHSIEMECNHIHLAFIPAAKVQFFEKEALFGEGVNAAFPSAKPEIKDAGNCLAADLNDAAVFHLMRAAEYGLRALARHLKVRIGQPLDYACWDHIIRAVKKKLVRLDAKPKGNKKAEELEFYGRLLMECTYFKDAWRNPVSHARSRFSDAGALDAFGHTREFMRRLAERVKEKS
jgi:hypothetical protein